MDVEQAFNVMLGSLYSVHAGRSQVLGVLAWRESACRAAACARACGGRAGVAGAGGAAVHGEWVRACRQIIGALRAMEHQAELAALRAAEYAADAAADRDRILAAAAAEPDPVLRRALLAQAMEAERARRKAERDVMAAEAWWKACNDAAAQGEFLVRQQDRVLAPVGRAVADAGGLPEVAQQKTYHTLGGM